MKVPYFSDGLTDRQIFVMMHYIRALKTTPDDLHYIKSEEYAHDLFPIDIVVFEPTKEFDYYVVGTVGLSDYRFDKNFSRSELIMALPKTWKPIFDKEEYYWAPQMVRDIAYCVLERKEGTYPGQVYLLTDESLQAEGGTYSPQTDAVGAILTFPEMFSLEMYEREMYHSYVRFLQVVPIDKNDVQKLDEIGPADFIKFDLHDSEGPTMVVKLKEKPLQGIDKLVKQNEDALKNNTSTDKE